MFEVPYYIRGLDIAGSAASKVSRNFGLLRSSAWNPKQFSLKSSISGSIGLSFVAFGALQCFRISRNLGFTCSLRLWELLRFGGVARRHDGTFPFSPINLVLNEDSLRCLPVAHLGDVYKS